MLKGLVTTRLFAILFLFITINTMNCFNNEKFIERYPGTDGFLYYYNSYKVSPFKNDIKYDGEICRNLNNGSMNPLPLYNEWFYQVLKNNDILFFRRGEGDGLRLTGSESVIYYDVTKSTTNVFFTANSSYQESYICGETCLSNTIFLVELDDSNKRGVFTSLDYRGKTNYQKVINPSFFNIERIELTWRSIVGIISTNLIIFVGKDSILYGYNVNTGDKINVLETTNYNPTSGLPTIIENQYLIADYSTRIKDVIYHYLDVYDGAFHRTISLKSQTGEHITDLEFVTISPDGRFVIYRKYDHRWSKLFRSMYLYDSKCNISYRFSLFSNWYKWR